MATARLEAILGLNTKGFEKGLQKARTQANDFAKGALKVLGAAAVAAGAALAAGTKHAISMGAELEHLSKSTGIAVSDLAVLRRAFEDNGISSEAVATSVAKMQRTIVEAGQNMTSYQRAFDTLELSWTDLLEMSPADQFSTIADAIGNMGDATKAAAAAQQIFGRSGAQLMPLFNTPGAIADARASLGRMPGVLEDMSTAFERMDTIMGRLSSKTDQFFVGFASRVAPQFLDPLEKANKLDFTSLGESLGRAVAPFIEAIKGGEIWGIMLKQAEAAIMDLMMLFVDFGRDLAAIISAGIRAGVEMAGQSVTGLLSGKRIGGVMQLPTFSKRSFNEAYSDYFGQVTNGGQKSNLRGKVGAKFDAELYQMQEAPTKRAYNNTAAAMLMGGGNAEQNLKTDTTLERIAAGIESIKESVEFLNGQVEIHP